jgi:hypothetical protein
MTDPPLAADELVAAAHELADWLVKRVAAGEVDADVVRRRVGYPHMLATLIETVVRKHEITYRNVDPPPDSVEEMRRILADHPSSQVVELVNVAFSWHRALYPIGGADR